MFYLWDFVEAQEVCHAHGNIMANPPNDSYEIFLHPTLEVGDKPVSFGKQIQDVAIDRPCIIIAVINMASKGDIGQKVSILIDLVYSKHQG